MGLSVDVFGGLLVLRMNLEMFILLGVEMMLVEMELMMEFVEWVIEVMG